MARYYPGFLAAFFIILLRIAIGWHFLTEGIEKLQMARSDKEAFSAEGYLRNATGPLAPYFRGMLPDVNGLALLDEPRLKQAWRDDVGRVADHFGFTESQRSQAAKLLDEAERWANFWFSDPENHDKRLKYYHDLREVQQTERDPEALSFQLERAWDARRSLDADRRTLTAPLIKRGKTLREEVAKLATADQLKAAGETVGAYLKATAAGVMVRVGLSRPDRTEIPGSLSPADAVPRPWTQLDVINLTTTYGLIAIGVCLILGLLTPLAALGAAGFLAMIYLSMPPWPGLPPNPRAEGHYFIVSKNLVELIACLVIATTPSGHWIGLDALVFGRRRRRRLAPPDGGGDQPPSPAQEHDRRRPVTEKEPDREPIPLS
jgi:uncharacterized membrane protein YphA (DoxX/SURF4 family)